jgi:Ca2+-binding RTX toxin-like protein
MILFLNLISLQLINAQTNSTLILENEASESSSRDTPKVSVSIEGTPNDDKIRGGDGDDEIKGEDGDDTIYGKSGNDNFDGDEGSDLLYGDGGDDELNGGDGDDELNGGDGSDELKGGNGADLFICDQDDDIVDFNSLEQDRKDGACNVVDQGVPISVNNDDADDEDDDDYNNGLEDEGDPFSSIRSLF